MHTEDHNQPACAAQPDEKLLAEYCRLGQTYRAPVDDLLNRYLDELRNLIRLPGRVLTNPIGRAYVYEFYLQQAPFERTLAIEISAVAPVALADFIERRQVDAGWQLDESDETPVPELAAMRIKVVTLLQQQGIVALPSATQDLLFDGRPLRHWLFCHPDD